MQNYVNSIGTSVLQNSSDMAEIERIKQGELE